MTNPKGSYDTSQDISVNTAIASPLLSRFDIILVLLDTSNKDWDLVVSTFILRQACGMVSDVAHDQSDTQPHDVEEEDDCSLTDGSAVTSYSAVQNKTKSQTQNHNRKRKVNTSSSGNSESIWGIEKLRKYLTYCKNVYKPSLSKEASEVLSRYWELQRGNEMRNAARTTVRK